MSIGGRVENVADCSCAVEAIDTLGVRSFAAGGAGAPRCTEMLASELPPPFRDLLVHPTQMSEALEQHYGAAVELHVMHQRGREEDFGRKGFLTLECRDAVIGYGLIYVRLHYLPDEVAKRIRQGIHPVGKVLARHGIARRVEPSWYVRLDRGSGYLRGFGTRLAGAAYGLVGTVYCNDRPTVEFFEMVTGVDPEDARRPAPRQERVTGDRRC